MNGNSSSVYEATTSAQLYKAPVPLNDLNNDDDNSKWSNCIAPLNFEHMKTDNFSNFLNDEFSIHKNDEALLADFTALLEDGDDNLLTGVDTTESNTKLLNTKKVLPESHTKITMSIHEKESTATTVAKTVEKTTETNNSKECNGIITSNTSQDITLVSTNTIPISTRFLQSSRCIGSIMSDHDYLSREDILQIIGHDETRFLQPSTFIVSSNGNVLIEENNPLDSSTTTSSSITPVKPATPEAVAIDTEISIPKGLNSLFKRLTENKTSASNLLGLIDELQLKAKLFKDDLLKSVDTIDPSKENVAHEKDTVSLGEKGMAESDTDAIFSCDHSEPMEYYGHVKDQSTSEDTEVKDDDEILRKIDCDLSKVETLNEEILMGIKVCKRDLYKTDVCTEGVRKSPAKNIAKEFGNLLQKIAIDLTNVAASLKNEDTPLTPAVIAVDSENKSAEKLCTNQAAQNEKDRKGSIDTEIFEENVAERPKGNESNSKLNENSKKRWLTDSSSSSSASDADDSDDGELSIRKKSKRKNKEADPSLSEINGVDDDDILIKNEPLLDSQKLTNEKQINTKRLSAEGGNLSETDTVLDINPEMSNDAEFYGFGLVDTEEYQHNSIEFNLKTEFSNRNGTEKITATAVADNDDSSKKSNSSENITADYSLIEADDILQNNGKGSPILDQLCNSVLKEAKQYETTEDKIACSPTPTAIVDQRNHEQDHVTNVIADNSSAKPIEDNTTNLKETSRESESNDNLESDLVDKSLPDSELLADGSASDDDGDIDDTKSDHEIEDTGKELNDKEIERLLDFTSLGIKRKMPNNNYVHTKTNGTSEPIRNNKKQKKDDEFMSILNKSEEKNSDSDSGSKSDSDEMTEEQFLKQHNLNLKNQLLQDTSSESDMDSDEENELESPKLNGTHKRRLIDDDDDDDDDGGLSDSVESLIDKFLENKTNEDQEASKVVDTEKRPKNVLESDTEKSNASSSSSNQSKSNSPPKLPDVNESSKSKSSDKENQSDNSDKEDENDGNSEKSDSSVPKRKSKIGNKAFSNLDKEIGNIFPSDDSETSDIENIEKAKRNQLHLKKKGSTDSSDCEILDTSMFKTTKKDIDSKQLSKLLTNSRKTKQSTSRGTPDECISLSSDDDLDLEPIAVENNEPKEAGSDDDEDDVKRSSRKLLRSDQLASETKKAQREEKDRMERLEKKNDRLSQIIESQRQLTQKSVGNDKPENTIEDVILDYDVKRKKNILVHLDILKHLKTHQIDGVKFMYDCCYGSVDSLEDHPGSGCILAHCMGLGKTLQLISLLHTVISHPQLKTDKVLVICPKSTVMNWKEEIERWLSPIKTGRKLKLFQFQESSDIKEKIKILRQWSQSGKEFSHAGCLLIGYEAFRTLVFYHSSKKSLQMFTTEELQKIRNSVEECLLNPGADLVICDEGHMIKNQKSTTSLAVNKIKTKRRVILTGTPIQNNLKEYYSMVNFIKPSFLGTEKEFANLYANPIKSGQHKDSSKREITIMKQRSYVLHNKLSKFVQRREAALLKTFLPEKYEYVLFIPMTDVQNGLYEYFLENNPLKEKLGGKSLISDYTILRKIWTHPKVLENAYLNAKAEQRRKQLLAAKRERNRPNNESEDEQPDDVLDSQTGKMSVTSDWWRPYVTKDDLETILPSNKLKVVFQILKVCEQNGEKCLIFSAFVAVLDVVEFFMRQITEQAESGKSYPGLETFRSTWKSGYDYYRLDGKTVKTARHEMITRFNSPDNARARCFLISAKAGGQGINLTGANRVILLDTSWNPSNDQQNIFRVFRLGQKRVCYIYRLLAMGTMEEKVYSRSVTKQAMSCRVVDEQQIDRHYNMAELTELYTLAKPDFTNRPTPNMPADQLLAYLLHNFPRLVYKYHEHDSLLERNSEQDLSEEEKADAWAAYENDVKRNPFNNMPNYGENVGVSSGYAGFASPYSSLFNTLGSNYGMTNAQMVAYLNQYSQMPAYSSTANMDYETDFLRQLYASPYSNYNSLYGGVNSSSAAAAAAASLYSSVSPGLLASPPPSVSSPSSILGYNQMTSSRNLMQSNPLNSAYNSSSNYISSLGQSGSGSKNNYSNSVMTNQQMQMFFNSYNGGNSGGSMTTVPAHTSSSSVPNTTKSSTPSTASSIYDSTMYAYLQNSLLSANNNATKSTSASSPASNSGAQGPNAKRNPMLSKELSIPSLLPSRGPNFETLNLPSIPTSVITKSSTSNASTTFATTGSSTLTTTATTIASSSTSNSATTTSVRTTTSNNSSKHDRKTSPEPHLIVKNVNAINKTVTNLSSTGSTNSNNKNAPTITTSTTDNSKKPTNSITNNVSKPADKTRSATPTSRGITNMGIVYPDKERTIEANKARNSPTPIINMGIVYPPSQSKDKQSPTTISAKLSTDSNTIKTAHTQLQSLNNKLSNKSGTVLSTEQPLTALATVNRVLQQQQQRRASPNSVSIIPTTKSTTSASSTTTSAASSPTLIRKISTAIPSSSTSNTITSGKQAVNTLANNKSLTVFQTNKRLSLGNNTPGKNTNLSSSITVSAIPTNSNTSNSSPATTKSFVRTIPKASSTNSLVQLQQDLAAKKDTNKNVSAQNSTIASKSPATWQARNSISVKNTSPTTSVTIQQKSNQLTNNKPNNGSKPQVVTMLTTKPNAHIQRTTTSFGRPSITTANTPNRIVTTKTSMPMQQRQLITLQQSNPKQTQIQKTNTPPALTRISPSGSTSAMKTVKAIINNNKSPSVQTGSNSLPSVTMLANRKRQAPPLSPMTKSNSASTVKGIIGSSGLSISQVKKPRLTSLANVQATNIRTTPSRKTLNAFHNVRIVPRQLNKSQTESNTQRNSQSISPVEIVELD